MLPFDVNGVQTLAFDPALPARLRDRAVDDHDVPLEFARLVGVASVEPEDGEDEDAARERRETAEHDAARLVWRGTWPGLLRAVRGEDADPLGPLPSAALYSDLVEGGKLIGRPADVPPDRRPLVDWLLAEGLARWLGPSLGLPGVEVALDPLFRCHTLAGPWLAERLGGAAPAAEVVAWCPRAKDPSAQFHLTNLVEGVAKNLRLGLAKKGLGPDAVFAVFPNYVRND